VHSESVCSVEERVRGDLEETNACGQKSTRMLPLKISLAVGNQVRLCYEAIDEKDLLSTILDGAKIVRKMNPLS